MAGLSFRVTYYRDGATDTWKATAERGEVYRGISVKGGGFLFNGSMGRRERGGTDEALRLFRCFWRLIRLLTISTTWNFRTLSG